MTLRGRKDDGARGFAARRWAGLGAAGLVLAVAASGCTAVEVTNDRRTDYVPRLTSLDRVYEVDVRIRDESGAARDGLLVHLRGIRKLNRFRDDPETEFYLYGRSGDGEEPGLLKFRFPAPQDTDAFDFYVVVHDERNVPSSHFFPGKYWTLKWFHHEVDLADGSALIELEPVGG